MIVLLIIILLSACSKSEVVAYPELDTKAQDSTYTPKPQQQDTVRTPIMFNVTITPWEEIK